MAQTRKVNKCNKNLLTALNPSSLPFVSSLPNRYRVSRTTPFPRERRTTMGDRSPKAVQKQASQKKAKTDSASQKKQQDLAAKAKLAVGKKK
jgi:hypothetical protein